MAAKQHGKLAIRQTERGLWYTGQRPRWGPKSRARIWESYDQEMQAVVGRLPVGCVICQWPSGRGLMEKIA